MGTLFSTVEEMKFLLLALAVASATISEITFKSETGHLPAPQSKFECTTCISFVSESLQELIQIIASTGVGGGCGLVCGKLSSHTLAEICDIVCTIAGIEEFGMLINEVDPDPIYICEKVHLCPHSTTAAANVTALTVSPGEGAQGTKFTIDFTFDVTNTIETGEFVVEVVPPASEPFGDGQGLFTVAPGSYSGQMSFTAKASEQEPFMPGSYQVVMAVCEGTCGSKHPWSQTLGEKQTSFKITE